MAPDHPLQGRRRLTMAPPAWRPPGCSGSRFICLGGLEAESSSVEDLEADHVAIQVATDSLCDNVQLRPDPPPGRRLPRTDAVLLQEFWTDVGF